MKNKNTYNGWKNYETWNVSLWIGNDESLYSIAKNCRDYVGFADKMNSIGEKSTPDGVMYGDCINGYGLLDIENLDKFISELN